jgi:hypothetical protein
MSLLDHILASSVVNLHDMLFPECIQSHVVTSIQQLLVPTVKDGIEPSAVLSVVHQMASEMWEIAVAHTKAQPLISPSVAAISLPSLWCVASSALKDQLFPVRLFPGPSGFIVAY